MASEISPSASVKLDGSGNGQVSLGPPSGTVWRLRLASVSTTSTARSSQCILYRGSTSGPIEVIDQTFLGNSSSSGKVAGAPFYGGQVLWAKWTGGDPGAQATLQAYGQQGTRSQLPFDAAVGEGFPLTLATVFQAGNTVINSSGTFVYSGPPALGNLIYSIAPAAGTDPYGNAYQAGATAYGTSGTSVQMLAGSPATVRLGTGDAAEAVPGLIGTLIDGAGPTGALASQLQAPQVTGETAFAVMRLESSSRDLTTSSPFVLIDVVNTAGSNSQVIVDPTDIRLVKNTSLSYLTCDGIGNQLIAGYPVVAATAAGGNAAETWHAMSLLNSWANNASFSAAQYRKVASPPNSVEIIGHISGNAATAATFATLPAGYRPATAQGFAAGTNGGNGGATMIANIRCDTAGNLTVANSAALPVAATFLFHGFISLDA